MDEHNNLIVPASEAPRPEIPALPEYEFETVSVDWNDQLKRGSWVRDYNQRERDGWEVWDKTTALVPAQSSALGRGVLSVGFMVLTVVIWRRPKSA